MELTKKLIIEIVNFINTNANTCQEKNILNILKKFSLTKNNYTYPNYNSPPKIKSLQKALSNIQSTSSRCPSKNPPNSEFCICSLSIESTYS